MKNLVDHREKRFALCIFALFIFAGGTRVLAGPPPMPLDVHLDFAEHVVVGELTQMQETDVSNEWVHYSRATVAVRETLKGQPTKTLSFRVASWVSRNYGGSSPLRVYKKGDSGIWVIKPGDGISRAYGLLAKDRRSDVQRILKSLEGRKWSNQVGGLKAWSGVVQYGYYRNPVIIFAVKNVSNADIYYPVELEPGVVTATAESSDKTVFEYPIVKRPHRKDVFCRKISPGKTVYLHPEYSFIDLARRSELPPGEYKVIVAYQNARNGETASEPGRRVPVEAWKGKLEAPAVKLLLAPEQEKGRDAPQGVPADAGKPSR